MNFLDKIKTQHKKLVDEIKKEDDEIQQVRTLYKGHVEYMEELKNISGFKVYRTPKELEDEEQEYQSDEDIQEFNKKKRKVEDVEEKKEEEIVLNTEKFSNENLKILEENKKGLEELNEKEIYKAMEPMRDELLDKYEMKKEDEDRKIEDEQLQVTAMMEIFDKMQLEKKKESVYNENKVLRNDFVEWLSQQEEYVGHNLYELLLKKGTDINSFCDKCEYNINMNIINE